MSIESMLKAMVHEIRVLGGTEDQVDAYLTDWTMATEDSANSLPCPSCYLIGEIKQLNHLDDTDGISKVRCTCCRKLFQFGNTM